nr:glycosyltransferase family 4 protein [Auraticoccus cholistanensis]
MAGLVVPVDPDPAAVGREDDLDAIRELVAPAPLFTTGRRRGLVSALHPRTPYVVASRPCPPDLLPRVRAQVPDADGVVVFAHKSTAIGRVLAEGLGLPAVLRQHNLEGPYHRALAAAARPPRSWAVALEALRIDRDERRLEHSSWLRGIADIAADDARTRASRSAVPVRHVPTFALGAGDLVTDRPWAPAGEPVVVFVGSLQVGTNHDALAWFAEHVWPRVREELPTARWQVVGRAPTDAVRALVARTPGAELHPDVPDPGVYLRRAAVAVNPSVSGSGVNIKVVEYLATGIPVVSTVRGQAGLGTTPGRDLRASDDPGEFAHHVLALLRSPGLARELGAAGRAAALRLLDVGPGLDVLDELLHPAPAVPAATTHHRAGATREGSRDDS